MVFGNISFHKRVAKRVTCFLFPKFMEKRRFMQKRAVSKAYDRIVFDSPDLYYPFMNQGYAHIDKDETMPQLLPPYEEERLDSDLMPSKLPIEILLIT